MSSAGRPGGELLSLLDFVKGVAIVMVVLYHGVNAWFPNFGWQGVHLFIVASGFLLTYSCSSRGQDRHWRRWFYKRLRRILPAYWLVALSGFAVVVLLALLGKNSPTITMPLAFGNLLLQLVLQQNFWYRAMMAYPNAAMWFVPLIAGFYIVFPALYRLLTRLRGAGALLGFVVAGLALEAALRAVAIYGLDGAPIGYGSGFLRAFGKPPPPLDLWPPSAPFQLVAPFGLFASRIGEFMLGMAAGLAYARAPGRWSRRLTGVAAWASGVAVWAGGNALVYAGRAGWPLADWAIAAGLALALPPVARTVRAIGPRVFRGVSATGRWSYHLFLVHLLVMYPYAMLYPLWMGSAAVTLLMFIAVIGAVVGATALLVRFDGWPVTDRMMRATFGRWLDAASQPPPPVSP